MSLQTGKKWERTHPTWKALKPRVNFNRFCDSDETEEEYAARIGAAFGFPAPVLGQWLYGLYYDEQSVNNYGWIDYSRVEFQEQRWSTDRLVPLRVINEYRPQLVERSTKFRSVDAFACLPRDRECWQRRGTWRVPPIILDMNGLGPAPEYSDVVGRFQLVEGHTRLSYLWALARTGGRLAPEHEVFVLTGKG